MRRIAIVVNKWWELDPCLTLLLSEYVRPKALNVWPTLVDHPRPRRNPNSPSIPGAASPRATFDFGAVGVEIWCISDLLEHLPALPKWQSSSQRKAERLPEVFAGTPPSLIVAIGTASAGENETLNGCVVVGTKCFMHNSKPNGTNPDSDWRAGTFDQVLDSSLTESEFSDLSRIDLGLERAVTRRLFSPPIATAREPTFLADYNAVAVGNINVTNVAEYEVTDLETLRAFKANSSGTSLGCLETTHGLIRSLGGSAFLFISGVVNRIGHFRDEVEPRQYAQNTVGAHNAGVVLAWMLPRLVATLA